MKINYYNEETGFLDVEMPNGNMQWFKKVDFSDYPTPKVYSPDTYFPMSSGNDAEKMARNKDHGINGVARQKDVDKLRKEVKTLNPYVREAFTDLEKRIEALEDFCNIFNDTFYKFVREYNYHQHEELGPMVLHKTELIDAPGFQERHAGDKSTPSGTGGE